ncbi:MAG: hypothetical protein NT175_10030 [Bacteroidetes bacterium]|nr:hypothetical protein [Bacteroidota bacterium]
MPKTKMKHKLFSPVADSGYCKSVFSTISFTAIVSKNNATIRMKKIAFDLTSR